MARLELGRRFSRPKALTQWNSQLEIGKISRMLFQSPEGSNSMEWVKCSPKTKPICFSRPKALTQWNVVNGNLIKMIESFQSPEGSNSMEFEYRTPVYVPVIRFSRPKALTQWNKNVG